MALYKIVRLRHRYLFTKNNKLRLRYLAGCVAVSSLVLSGFFGSINSSVAYSPSSFDVSSVHSFSEHEDNRALLDSALDLHNASEQSDRVIVLKGDADFHDIEVIGVEEGEDDVHPLDFTNVEKTPALTLPREELLDIGTGDTLAGVLQGIGVSGADAYKAVKALSKHYDPRDVKPGQAISVTLEPGDEGIQLGGLNMKLSAVEEVHISRDEMGRYSAEKDKKEVQLQMVAAKASIETSLYGSAAKAGIPASMVAEMIRIYSYEIDFQRDIREGDKVEVLYETYETEDGDFARYGNILYANLIVGDQKIPVYRFDSKNGENGYYKENGKSLKRTLMSTPVDGARMSSGFGMRHHPVLGYNKMHKGIDFAASRGTPIYAAGDGVIEKSGRNGGYGNYIRIKHNGSLKTAYAHMHRFAKGMKPGKRVKQGDVIGYVGTTGRSTGPHLHFEVLRDGKQVNPKSIKSAGGDRLSGQNLASFKSQVAHISRDYASLSKGMEFASNEISE